MIKMMMMMTAEEKGVRGGQVGIGGQIFGEHTIKYTDVEL